MDTDFTSELHEILSRYDLGELVEAEKNERGYVNTSFAIQTVKNGVRSRYFLRKYKAGIQLEELVFEHSLINHLVTAGSPPVAKLHRTRKGATFVHRLAGKDDRTGVYYAIFDFLPGEDRYTWVAPRCTQEEVKNSAIALARFHQAVSQFAPQGRRAEPRILDLLPVIAQNLASCPDKSKNTIFDAYLLKHYDLVQEDIANTLAALSHAECQDMPQIVVHCDYHPGNLMFRGGEITGLFDFDWSKVDFRCFDVALATWYFFDTWEEPHNGQLRLDEVRTFLSTYQETLSDHPTLGPLSEVELNTLPTMFQAANLYVLNWTVFDYYQKEVNPEEYLIYLRHGIKSIEWFSDPVNRIRLEELIQGPKESN
jgi:homoserine kinase type II